MAPTTVRQPAVASSSSGTVQFGWPVQNTVECRECPGGVPFGQPSYYQRNGHTGRDYVAAEGTPLTAIAAGEVVIAAWWPPEKVASREGHGNTVIIFHGTDPTDGLRVYSVYGHMSRFSVSAGDSVEGGETIGLSGNTGYSGGPHLHFGILKLKSPLTAQASFPNLSNWRDPEDWLGKSKSLIPPSGSATIVSRPVATPASAPAARAGNTTPGLAIAAKAVEIGNDVKDTLEATRVEKYPYPHPANTVKLPPTYLVCCDLVNKACTDAGYPIAKDYTEHSNMRRVYNQECYFKGGDESGSVSGRVRRWVPAGGNEMPSVGAILVWHRSNGNAKHVGVVVKVWQEGNTWQLQTVEADDAGDTNVGFNTYTLTNTNGWKVQDSDPVVGWGVIEG